MELSTKKIKDFRFYFKKESVIMEYNQQYICFNSFNERNKRLLKNFAEGIQQSKSMNLDTVFRLARQNNVPSMLTTKASIYTVEQLKTIKHNSNRISW